MKIIPLFFLLTIAAYSQTPTASPSATPESNPIAPFWRAVLPGGIFRVKLDRIQSVSTHEYDIQPLTHVTEFTVDAGGSLVARFYYLETLAVQSPVSVGQSGIDMIKAKAEELAKAVAGDANPERKVIKVYPATTHAHTVEYRVESKSDIDKLMKSAEKAWSTNRGAEIKIN